MDERLRIIVSQMVIEAQENEIHITASFGVTSIDPETLDEKASPEIMIDEADKYLHQAKREGRNRMKAGKQWNNFLNQKELSLKIREILGNK